MPTLNTDIIQLILDLLHWDNDGVVDRPSLAAACRISRAWHRPAQARLFHAIKIESRDRLLTFNRSVPPATKRGRVLRSMVHELTFLLSGHSAVLGVSPAHSLLERDLVALLLALPNLYQLRVNAFCSWISRSTRSSLSSTAMPRIKSLIVNYLDDPPDRNHHIFFDLLGALRSSVDRAMFVGKGTYQWRLLQKGNPPFQIQADLKELRLDLHHSQPCVTGEDLAGLVGHSLRSLEILHLYDIVVDQTMPSFISSVAAQLRSFHVSSSRRVDLQDLPEWVRLMTHLRELVIRNDLASANCFRVATDLAPLMAALPSNIQHLGFAVDSQHAISLVHSQIELWSSRVGHGIPVFTLIVPSGVHLDFFERFLVGRSRIYHNDDADIAFAFVS